jgi:hypothetical protein
MQICALHRGNNVRLMEDSLLPVLKRLSSASHRHLNLCLTVTGHGDGVHLLTGPTHVFGAETVTNPWGSSYENI